MRITFCDLCDESIPFTDLEGGRAVRRKGRSICARCEEAMGKAPPSGEGPLGENGERPAAAASAPPSARRPGPVPQPPLSTPVVVRTAPSGAGLAVALAVVALLFTCGAAVFLLERIDRTSRGLAGLRSSWGGELERSSESLEERLDGRVARAAIEARDALQEAQRVGHRLDEGEGARAASLDDVRLEIAGLSERLAAIASRPRGGGGADAGSIDRLEKSVADLHREVLRVSERLRGLEGNDGESLELPVEPDQERPAWWPHVGGLKSNNAGTRWGAVQALGETRDPQVAEHLTPMLKDPDIFVRMATARVLGDLRSVISIPALIEALDDAESSVREAAVVSLRTVSGQNFAYDPAADPTERAKRVSAWREWWEKSRGRLLGGR